MRYFITLFVVISFFIQNFYFLSHAATPIFASDNKFVVSAYYSPCRDQDYFHKGSFEAEVRLNGQGVSGASGKGVFPGMVAAPKNYAFGTKIYLEGIGVVDVQDRGGAIVSTNSYESRGYSYDRIDLWMGYCDEGLARALQFGKQTISGYILADSSTPVSINLNNFPAPFSILSKYRVEKSILQTPQISQQAQLTSQPKNILSHSLQINPKKSNPDDVKKLQEIFAKMNIYKGNIDGIFESIQPYFVAYQVHRKIIPSQNHNEAGYFGPKTLAQINIDYRDLEKKNKIIANISNKYIENSSPRENKNITQNPPQKTQEVSQEEKIKQISLEKTNEILTKISSPLYGQTGEHVRYLQKTLSTLGYFPSKDTGVFGDITKVAVIDYQLQKSIIPNTFDAGAGIVGPKTKESLKQDLFTLLEKKAREELQSLTYKK